MCKVGRAYAFTNNINAFVVDNITAVEEKVIEDDELAKLEFVCTIWTIYHMTRNGHVLVYCPYVHALCNLW